MPCGPEQNIPPQLYEAATIDGAGAWRRFIHITLPMLTPVLVVAIVLLILEDTFLSDLGNLHLAGIVTLYLSLVLGYVSGGQYVWSFWKQVVAKGL